MISRAESKVSGTRLTPVVSPNSCNGSAVYRALSVTR
jgi:hypothetical protein